LFDDHHLLRLALAYLPALLYAFFISRYDRTITLRTTLAFFIGGFLAMEFLYTAQQAFPNLQDLLVGILFLANLDPSIPDEVQRAYSMVFYMFVQVGLVEETIKGAAFWVMWRIVRPTATLFATMFYCCMVSVCFAGAENLHYFIELADDNVILIRTFTAVVVHMVCGLFMGYFIAMSSLEESTYGRIKRIAKGILCAAAFHGLYDWLTKGYYDITWMNPMNKEIITIPLYYPLIPIGVITCFFLGRDLIARRSTSDPTPKRSPPSPPEE